MNKIIEAIQENLTAKNVRFVFPSQTAADLWARKICTLGIIRSVAANRFLAWDRFKEEVIKEKETKRTPSSLITRKLFAEALLRRNAEAVKKTGLSNSGGAENEAETRSGLPLKSIVPPEYAASGGIFVPFIARLLPSLALWEKMKGKSGRHEADTEDEDYITVKNEYSSFLERHKLFEPSWEEIKIGETDSRYVIFFPELIEDFSEYDELLKAPRFVRVNAEASSQAASEKNFLLCYGSAREEIRSAVTELRRLHEEEGVPYEDMALSVPELEEMEPYLLKEFYLRHIPVTRRAGKKLGETGAGRLFSLVNECAVSNFSFNSLKALVLNDHIPWREREKNKALINFGIKYNCVSSYTAKDGIKNIWDEAFKEAHNNGERELWSYYRELKKRILNLAGAENFREIRKCYFAFRGYAKSGEEPGGALLDMEKITKDDDAVLGRCIRELGGLIELEEKLNDPELVPASPFSFFLSSLGEIEYVKARQKPGVNIFKWRVAAAAPFECHFVLNASQSAASVLYRPMKFLRQDKRKALGLEDTDATGAFFTLCDTGDHGAYMPRVRVSVSSQTFSGWAIPHSFFAQGRTASAPPCPEEPYKLERDFWKGTEEKTPELKSLFPLQKESFSNWKKTIALKKNNFVFFDYQLAEIHPLREPLENAILESDGFLTVSPTRDLNVYYQCSLLWLYTRIFGVEEFSLEAALLDDTSLGILYHRILEKLFSKIRDEDGAFDSRRLGAYKNWALEITGEAIREHPAFSGPLAVPLLSPQAAGMSKKIGRLLELEAKFFDGCGIAELELPVSFKTGGLNIKGTIDRVSLSSGGEPFIVDYKTTYLPEQTAMDELDENALSEFQMPLYIKLYEEMSLAASSGGGSAKKVEGAFFYSINNRKIKSVMGERAGGKTKAPNREEYEPYLEAAEKQIEEFGQRVKALDFIPRKIRFADCFGCAYKTVCRTAYGLG